MTKKQMSAECTRLAPDFKMIHEKRRDVATVVVSCTVRGEPVAMAMSVKPLGRAAVETRLLEAMLAKLRGVNRSEVNSGS